MWIKPSSTSPELVLQKKYFSFVTATLQNCHKWAGFWLANSKHHLSGTPLVVSLCNFLIESHIEISNREWLINFNLFFFFLNFGLTPGSLVYWSHDQQELVYHKWQSPIKISEVLWVRFQERFWVENFCWHHDSNPRPFDLCSSDSVNRQPNLALFCLNPHGGTFKYPILWRT